MKKLPKKEFTQKWQTYFKSAKLPLIFFYSNDIRYQEFLKPLPSKKRHVCLIGQLDICFKGKTIAFTKDTIGCGGGVRYSGFPYTFSPDFYYFLSCGVPGRLEGERYKKSPEIVKGAEKDMPKISAEGKFIVFKKWDLLEEEEEPVAVVFWDRPDVISGLFTLANFRTVSPQGVIAPFSSGCGSMIAYPVAENRRKSPRAVLGMFDISARPYVDKNVLSLAVPIKKFIQMIEDMVNQFPFLGEGESSSHGKNRRRSFLKAHR